MIKYSLFQHRMSSFSGFSPLCGLFFPSYNLLWNFSWCFFSSLLWPGLSKETIDSDRVMSLLPNSEHLQNHHFCNRTSSKILLLWNVNYFWKSRPRTQASLKLLFILYLPRFMKEQRAPISYSPSLWKALHVVCPLKVIVHRIIQFNMLACNITFPLILLSWKQYDLEGDILN